MIKQIKNVCPSIALIRHALKIVWRLTAMTCVAGVISVAAPLHAAQSTITTTVVNNVNDRYAYSMIELALRHLEKPYQLTSHTGEERTQGRIINDVMTGGTDIMWTATSGEVEQDLLPIRIPLYKGLLGHRIFIIHRGDQAKFDHVKTFQDLQRLTLGQGTVWADTKILEANQLQVVKANKYHSLLYMVDGGRFDAFPRGVQEPWNEIEGNPDLELAVEKNLMLVYRMPFYLFVNKNNKELAADIELGLNRAIADGSFDEVFFNDPTVHDVLTKANLKQRLVFNLTNPTLPPETPLNRQELWLDIGKL